MICFLRLVPLTWTSAALSINFEVNAFMYDVETALEMKEIFLQDQRESTQIFLKNWVRRSWRQKAAESVVRLLAPLL